MSQSSATLSAERCYQLLGNLTNSNGEVQNGAAEELMDKMDEFKSLVISGEIKGPLLINLHLLGIEFAPNIMEMLKGVGLETPASSRYLAQVLKQMVIDESNDQSQPRSNLHYLDRNKLDDLLALSSDELQSSNFSLPSPDELKQVVARLDGPACCALLQRSTDGVRELLKLMEKFDGLSLTFPSDAKLAEDLKELDGEAYLALLKRFSAGFQKVLRLWRKPDKSLSASRITAESLGTCLGAKIFHDQDVEGDMWLALEILKRVALTTDDDDSMSFDFCVLLSAAKSMGGVDPQNDYSDEECCKILKGLAHGYEMREENGKKYGHWD